MRRLIISDIHANLPALEAVLSHAGSCDEIIFLGDLANFGPHPSECVNLIRDLKATCIMGNHDKLISFKNEKRNFWDEWSRTKLTEEQLFFLQSFDENKLIDGDIFLLHGSYEVDYDILPNTPPQQVKNAFEKILPTSAGTVLFGHYHYQVDIDCQDVSYHCIRPVGHHRDKDNRAGYSILSNGKLTHFRVPYDIEKTIFDIKKIDCFDEEGIKKWQEFLRNAYDENVLRKDIEQMEKNKTFYV